MEYHVPSWSWTVVIGPISFQIWRLDIRVGDQVSPVRNDGMLEMAKVWLSLLEQVDIDYKTNPSIRYGPPEGQAPLAARGPTILAS